jgi:hypothetical protein
MSPIKSNYNLASEQITVCTYPKIFQHRNIFLVHMIRITSNIAIRSISNQVGLVMRLVVPDIISFT